MLQACLMSLRGGMRRPHVQDHLLALDVGKVFGSGLRGAPGAVFELDVVNFGHDVLFANKCHSVRRVFAN